MSKFKTALMIAAKEMFESQKMTESVAVISPTPPDLINAILSDIPNILMLTPAEMVGSMLMDLGCGDGRWLIAWVKSFPGCIGCGCDIDEERLLTAQVNARRELVDDKIELMRIDFKDINMKVPKIIVAYLSRCFFVAQFSSPLYLTISFRVGNTSLSNKLIDEGEMGTLIIAVGVCCFKHCIFIDSFRDPCCLISSKWQPGKRSELILL